MILVVLTTITTSSITEIFDVSFLLGKAQVSVYSGCVVDNTVPIVDSVPGILVGGLCHWVGLYVSRCPGCQEK